MLGRLIARSALGMGAAGCAGAAYAHHMMTEKPTDFVSRSLIFWTRAAPVLAHYRAASAWSVVAQTPRDEYERELNAMHDRYADQILDTILELRGFYIKIGQVLATRADMLPPVWIERMKTLEDAVPARSFDAVRATIERELGDGRTLESVFSEFDRVPIGSASIGQVHRARLRDSGQVVAVKVQCDDAERLFRGDIANMRWFCQVAQPEQVIVFDEIERSFMTEFDYRAEAANLTTVRHNLRQFADRVAVPEAFPQYTTRKMLVMEYFDGVKLITAIRGTFERLARASGKSMAQLEAEFKENKAKNAPASAPALPSMATLNFALRLDAARRSAHYWAAWCFNALIGAPLSFLLASPGRFTLALPEWSETDRIPLLDYAELSATLIHVHAHALLVDGCFNGDPHPGNILYLADGRLGLIDYGQTKRLTKEQRLSIARTYLSLAQRDGDATVAHALATGSQWRRNDPYVIEKTATVFFDRDSPDVTEGMNGQIFFEHLNRLDPMTKIAEYFIMAGRMTMLLRAVAYAFQLPLSFATLVRPIAESVLLAEGTEADKVVAARKGYHPSGLMKNDRVL
jgi:aarF domain-containing kinase